MLRRLQFNFILRYGVPQIHPLSYYSIGCIESYNPLPISDYHLLWNLIVFSHWQIQALQLYQNYKREEGGYNPATKNITWITRMFMLYFSYCSTGYPLYVSTIKIHGIYNAFTDLMKKCIIFCLSFLFQMLEFSFYHILSWEPEGHYHYLNSVPLRTRKALYLHKVYGDSALLVLNGTSLDSINTLLLLSLWNMAFSVWYWRG